MRLIDADKLRREIFFNDYSPLKIDDNSNALGNEILRIIDNAPTVERKPFATVTFDKDELERIVEERIIEPIKNGELVIKKERPQGEWIKHIDNLYPEDSTEECPFCHEEQRLVGNDDNFCPNCGAKMMKEVNDAIN